MKHKCSELFFDFQTENSKRYSKAQDKKVLENIAGWINTKEADGETFNPITDLDGYVDQCKGDKARPAKLILAFYGWLQRKGYESQIETELDKIALMDIPVLRQLEITKYLHEKHTVKEISEHFKLTSRSITGDLNALADGIQVMGSKVKISEQSDAKHPKQKFYKSTLHPVFLPLNLTEVWLLTVGLMKYTRNSPLYWAYQTIADRIYSQLSDYGKEKINAAADRAHVSLHEIQNNYRNEEEMVTGRDAIGCEILAYAMKADLVCDVTIKENEKEILLKDVRSQWPKSDHICLLVEPDGTEHEVEEKNIISVFVQKYR